MRWFFLAMALAGLPLAAMAQILSGPADPRIRTLDYVANGVIDVPVSKGVVTRIVLEHGEKIIAAATGVPSKCDDAENLWCVVADADTNEVWVKPKKGAGHNNLELKTDRRDYSIELSVGSVATYRVVLHYPDMAGAGGAPHGPSEAQIVADRLAGAHASPRNLSYSLESNRKGEDITPKAVWDDGRFTHFNYPGNCELPTIFVIASDGKESRVNFHMTGDDMVVEQLGRQFVLRLGKSVVSVWNDKFDAQGVAPKDGTTVAGVGRETIGAADAR